MGHPVMSHGSELLMALHELCVSLLRSVIYEIYICFLTDDTILDLDAYHSTLSRTHIRG